MGSFFSNFSETKVGRFFETNRAAKLTLLAGSVSLLVGGGVWYRRYLKNKKTDPATTES